MAKTSFPQIKELVSKIPRGKVATYGQIASLAGIKNARVVGWAIRNNQDKNVPCHRVVMVSGSLAKDFSLGGWEEQKRRLEPEGVLFVEEYKVDLEKCLWDGVIN
jgi:methylated-DNA-protein-cysteine methyltransferase-like protein